MVTHKLGIGREPPVNITAVNAYPLAKPVENPCWTAHEYFDTARLILVEVETDDGTTGFGEIRGSPQALICDYIDRLADVITGDDALGHVEIWEKLMASTSPRPGGLGDWDGLPAPIARSHRPQVMAAIAGIDIALWDIKGKAAALPIYQLLGGTDTTVDVYGTGGFYTEGEPLDTCAEELAGFVEDGYTDVKLKTGALSFDEEVERVRLTREAIGPDPTLLLDLNAPYDIEECIRFSKAVDPYDVMWLEEPIHWYYQPADFKKLADASPIPLAHGEREWHRFTIRDFIDSGSIRYVQFDSTRAAGFTESLRIAHYAEQAGVTIAPHAAPRVHAHLVSAFNDASYAAETIETEGFFPIPKAIYADGPTIRSGTIEIPDTPGFGIEIDWNNVENLKA